MADTPSQSVEPDAVERPTGFGTHAALLALLVGLFCWGLMMPVPFRGRMGMAVGNMLHAPAFALLAFCAHRVARLRSRTRERSGSIRSRSRETSDSPQSHDFSYRDTTSVASLTTGLAVWLALVLFGGATEIAQGYVGRGSSWGDAVNDALGAAAGVLISMALERPSLLVKLSGVVLGVIIVLLAELDSLAKVIELSRQRQDMPLLASFEWKPDMDAWAPEEGVLRRVTTHATHGRWALRVDLRPAQYSGLAIYDPPADWSKYQELAFDIFVEPAGSGAKSPLELIVKVEDTDHNGIYDDRFHRMLKLAPGPHTVRIPLTDVALLPNGRNLDLKKIAMLQFFTIHLAVPRTFYLDNIRLK